MFGYMVMHHHILYYTCYCEEGDELDIKKIKEQLLCLSKRVLHLLLVCCSILLIVSVVSLCNYQYYK